MSKKISNFSKIVVIMLQIALIFPAFAAEDDIYHRNGSEKYSQIYLSGRKEGELFWKYENIFTCPESSFDSRLGEHRHEGCTPHSVGICQKVYCLDDGSLASEPTCQESCVREINKPVYIPATCTLF